MRHLPFSSYIDIRSIASFRLALRSTDTPMRRTFTHSFRCIHQDCEDAVGANAQFKIHSVVQ